MQAKINPYLRPLLERLREMMDFEQVKRYMEDDVIEVVPLAYMRGRTLNNAFIIMDEAQNTTVSQMKMFLTRMGWNSKVVVSGDTSQVDLPPHTKSGLIDAIGRLRNIEGYANIVLGKEDIVRHRLVQEIVSAYVEVPSEAVTGLAAAIFAKFMSAGSRNGMRSERVASVQLPPGMWAHLYGAFPARPCASAVAICAAAAMRCRRSRRVGNHRSPST